MSATLPADMLAFWGEPISVYTREQAIEDGELVDVTEWASATSGFLGGFTCPVAMTRSVFALCEPPKGSMQDLRGRAHDVLWMCRCAARGCRSDRLTFKVLMGRRYVTLRAVIDGDGVTIMRPEED